MCNQLFSLTLHQETALKDTTITLMDIHKVLKTTFHRLILLLLLSFTAIVANAESYPAHCRVTTTLNVRSGPGTSYSKIGKFSGLDVKKEFRVAIGIAIVAFIQEQIALIKAGNKKKKEIQVFIRV